MKNFFIILLIAVCIGLVGYLVYSLTNENKKNTASVNNEQTQAQAQIDKDNCVADDCLSVSNLEYPVATLSTEVQTAIKSAIDDEYKAYSTYDSVIKKIGNVRPFSMIIRAEEQHIASLKAIFDKYGVAIPDNQYLGKIASPATLSAACSLGSDAEIANAALYRETLIPAVTAHSDITSVFNTLMKASQEKHLPAFDKCR